MGKLRFNINDVLDVVTDRELATSVMKAGKADASLLAGDGAGSDFLGWLDLPADRNESQLKAITDAAANIRKERDALVVIGIGGSYLGARAAIDALTPTFQKTSTEVLFAGCNLTSDYHAELLDHLADKDFAINVISKSGTTLEPSIAFRLLTKTLKERFGEDGARDRIIATTDPKKGVLRRLADDKGYQTFDIPDDVGGRFSVMTPVGLLPIAAAGIDIVKLLDGADGMREMINNTTGSNNPCHLYAAVRDALYGAGKTIEILSSFNVKLAMMCEWWKQLAGESEGKEGKGLFPASVVNTTDLHSLGQWIQEGQRTIFETFLTVTDSGSTVSIPEVEDDPDGLNYIAGRTMDDANRAALQGTDKAHRDGGVPTMSIEIDLLDAECIGALFYFFERTIAIGGYMLGINPFNQPGVEAYKKNMFELLGRP